MLGIAFMLFATNMLLGAIAWNIADLTKAIREKKN